MVKGQLIGILNMDHTQPNAYSDRFANTIIAFANQAAVAIENARLYEETRQRANEMRILHQVALATSVLLDLDSLLRQTTSMIAESLYPEHFGFLLINEITGELFPHASFYGASKEKIENLVPLDESVCGMVIQTGQPRIISNVSSEEIYFCVLPSTQSEIVVPLTVKEKVIGVINVESSIRDAFSTNDLRFLTTLAGQVATFIERLHLYESQRKYMAHLALEVNKRTEALKSERDRMQTILDNAGEGIFFTDNEGVILYVNSSMSRVTGFEAAELLHRTPDQWPGLHNRELLDSLMAAVELGQGWHSELVGQHKNNSFYDIHLTIAPIFSNEGILSGFVGVQSDISHLKEVERLKAQFISNVSHELRTPLTIIETYTTLLKQGKPERRDYYLTVLGRETKRLTRLIQDVLDLSRLEADKSLIVTESVRLDRLLRRVSKTFLPHAETKQIALTLELDHDLPTVWANKGQIEQVVTNLVNNALVYTPDEGEVVITAGTSRQNEQEGVWFSIVDTGSGISPEDLPQIFERFFRSQSAQISSVRGTGLGLAICKEIVERHNGLINAKSSPGLGSVFTVWLPVGEPTNGT
jgi:PAS domain S-box-containing protein